MEYGDRKACEYVVMTSSRENSCHGVAVMLDVRRLACSSTHSVVATLRAVATFRQFNATKYLWPHFWIRWSFMSGIGTEGIGSEVEPFILSVLVFDVPVADKGRYLFSPLKNRA